VDAFKFERQARQLVALGPRIIAELLAELERGGVLDIRGTVDRYAALDLNTLRAFGADRFPPRLFAVVGDQ